MVKNFPSLAELEQLKERMKNFPNQKGEFLRKVHYGCFLLCSQAGLRISEAIKFDLNSKTRKGLYRISKCKGKKKRLVYIPRKVIRELRKNNWKPHQTNRWNFYWFLQKIKREANIRNVELTPHTLRRTFTTYHAEKGTPLPLLQKLLGHSSIRTTALYWQNIYGDDPKDILTGKNWLERNPPKPLSVENFPKPKNPEPIIRNKPVITAKEPSNQDNSLLTVESEKNPVINQPQLTKNFPPPTIKKADKPSEIGKKFSEQLPVISKKEPTDKEKFLLTRIKQLEEQLKQTQTENEKLKIQLTETTKEKNREQERTNYYQQQLEKTNKNHNELEIYSAEQVQIEQKPPWRK